METYICEHCGASFIEDWRKDPKSRRIPPKFCSISCSRARTPTDEQNQKRRLTLQETRSQSLYHCSKCGRACKSQQSLAQHEQRCDANASRERRIKTLKNTLTRKFANRKIRSGGDELDITKEELRAYRGQHLVCEICGNAETLSFRKDGITPNNLCVDHDHSTKKFRGLLCHKCNSMLGWYENNKDLIDKYLLRGKQ